MSRLTIRLFGPPKILLDDQPIKLTQRKPIALLSYLAATRKLCSRDELAVLLWPESRRAKDNLRNVLWMIQEALGDYTESILDVERDVIRIHSDTALWADVNEFRDRVAAYTNLDTDLEDSQTLKPHVDAICGLYDGVFMAGFTLHNATTFDDWQFMQREELHQLFISTLTKGVEHFEAVGEREVAIKFVQRLVNIEPTEEIAHVRLMKLYAEAGQHVAAARQYQTCRQILQKELAVEPSAETNAVFESIQAQLRDSSVISTVAQEEHLSVDISIAETDSAQGSYLPPEVPSNLPHRLNPLLGRESELSELRRMLSDPIIRLVTLTGPGGVGKTSLAIEVAAGLNEFFPDGVVMVSLAPIRHADFVMPALLEAVNVTCTELKPQQSSSNKPSLDLLKQMLGQATILLLVDNFEHLLDSALQVAELLESCPNVKVLTTSREPLQLDGEHTYVVAPLSVGAFKHARSFDEIAKIEAVQLFCQRARMARRNFELTAENVDSVFQICKRLDGMPLALELAAPYMKTVTAQELLKKLEDGTHLELASRNRNVPERHRTLADMVAWSYDLLSDDEQKLFHYLSIFPGSFTLEAAATLWDESGQPEACMKRAIALPTTIRGKDAEMQQYLKESPLNSFTDVARNSVWSHLSSLIDKNLVHSVLLDDKETRYVLLETIREYGYLQLCKDTTLTLIHRRFYSYYVSLVVTVEFLLESEQHDDLLRRLDREQNALNAVMGLAIENNEGAIAIRMENGLHQYRMRRRQIRENSEWLLRLLPILEQMAPTASIAKFYFKAGITCRVGAAEQMRLFNQSLALGRECGDQESIVYSLALLADLAYECGDYDLADAYNSESLDGHLTINDPWGYATKLSHTGRQTAYRGNVAHGAEMCSEALTLQRNVGDPWGICLTLWNSIQIAFLQQNLDEAGALIQEGTKLAQSLGDGDMIAHMFRLAGLQFMRLGQLDHASVHLRQAVANLPHAQTANRVGDLFEVVAEFEVEREDFESALFLCAYVEFVRAEDDVHLPPLKQRHFDYLLDCASDSISESGKAAIIQRGRNATLEEMVAFAKTRVEQEIL